MKSSESIDPTSHEHHAARILGSLGLHPIYLGLHPRLSHAALSGLQSGNARFPVPAGLKAREVIPRAAGPGSHAEQQAQLCKGDTSCPRRAESP